MDSDKYLNFFFKSIKEKRLEPRKILVNYNQNKRIEKKDIIKKEVECTLALVEVKIESGEILIFEDIPLHFILSQTILIGKYSKLKQFKKETDIKDYIAPEHLIEFIPDIDKTSIKTTNVERFKQKKFSFKFKQPELIQNLKEYTLKKKNIDLNKIHIIEGNEVTNFIPQMSHKHLAYAIDLNLLPISIIKDNFVKETIINCFDEEKHLSIIEPATTRKEKLLWDFDKNSNEKTIRDIGEEVYYDFDMDKILQDLQLLKNSNEPLSDIYRQISEIDKIKLHSSKGDIPLPLWRARDKDPYLLIKDSKDFKELFGREFKGDKNYLKSLYMQNGRGEQLFNIELNLKPEFEKCFSQKETDTIIYTTIEDLIISLSIYENAKTIMKKGEHNNFHSKHLKREIRRLCEFFIKRSIEINSSQKNQRPEEILEMYFASVCCSINKLNQEHKNSTNNDILIKKVISHIKYVNFVTKQFEIKENQLHYIYELICSALDTLDFVDKNAANYIKDLLHTYFPKATFQFQHSYCNSEIEEFIQGVVKVNLSNSPQVYLKEKIDQKIFKKNCKFIKLMPENFSEIIINKPLIQNSFPKNYDEVVKKLEMAKGKEDFITLGKNKINIKKEFFTQKTYYPNHRLISDNSYFLAVEEKGITKKPESFPIT